MISIICISNNEKILDDYLLSSLKKQTYKDYELIIMDNTNNQYKCAISAFNEGVKKAKGDTLLFVHHDVKFEDKNELENIAKQINNLEYGIVGVAGASFTRNSLIGNITNGPNKEKISNNIINEPTKVQTLDEVLFIIKRETLEKYPFDTSNDTWHLYAVEYSLNMHNNNKQVYVIPSNIYHASPGYSLNKSYFKYLPKVIKKYKKNYKNINTTVGSWYTNKLLFNIQLFKHKRSLK